MKVHTSRKFHYLLAVLIVFLLGYPFLEGNRLGEALITFITVCVLVVCVRILVEKHRNFWIAFIIAAPPLYCSFHRVVAQTDEGSLLPYHLVLEMFFLGLFFIYCTFIMFSVLMGKQEITYDVLCGAASIYLMFALIWSLAYALVEELVPGSFHLGLPYSLTSQELNYADFIYFSFTTITTLGYGDMVPLSSYARSLAIFEATFGVFYIATLVARFATLLPRRRLIKDD